MAALTGHTVASTYADLLQAGNGGSGVSASTLTSLSDGTGHTLNVKITQSKFQFGNTGFSIADGSSAYNFNIVPSSTLTADRTLTITTGDADRTVTLSGNLSLAANFSTSGANALTLTTTGSTNVTLPTSGTLLTSSSTDTLTNKSIDLANNTLTGTLAQFNTSLSGADFVSLAGSETLTNKTLTSPTITGATITTSTYNGLAITASTGTLTVTNDKTLSVSNTLTFTGTDSSSVAFGTGGTVLYSGGALGTPSSGNLSNCTSLPISTGVSGLGTDVATFLATPSSANLRTAVTDATGSGGSLVFATSPTITTPVIAQINDSNGNETIKFTEVSSAVNEFTFANAATTGQPKISVTGDDTNIGLTFQTKGTGQYTLNGTSTTQAVLNFQEQTTNGANKISVSGPASITTDRSVIWKDTMDGYPVLDTTASDAWTDFTPAFTGFVDNNIGTTVARYKKFGKTCFITVVTGTTGTSNSTAFTMTGLPFAAAQNATYPVAMAFNNSAATGLAQAKTTASSTTLTLCLSNSSTGWTSSGVKYFACSFAYETA